MYLLSSSLKKKTVITSVSSFIVIITAIIVYINMYKYLTDKDVFEYIQIEEDTVTYYTNTTFTIKNNLRVILSDVQLQDINIY